MKLIMRTLASLSLAALASTSTLIEDSRGTVHS